MGGRTVCHVIFHTCVVAFVAAGVLAAAGAVESDKDDKRALDGIGE